MRASIRIPRESSLLIHVEYKRSFGIVLMRITKAVLKKKEYCKRYVRYFTTASLPHPLLLLKSPIVKPSANID